MFKHILVPTDGSELSCEAITKAVVFARETSARITFFNARPAHKGYLFGEGALDNRMTQDEFAEAMRLQSQEILERAVVVATAAGVESATASQATESPYRAIIEAATKAGCDGVFMASHGRSGVSGLLLGSETMKVLTHCKIPVLVYR